MKPITFLINVHNEENRISTILDNALKWADEVLVMDCGSTDDTVMMCLQRPGVRVSKDATRYQYSEGIAEASHDWVYVATPSELPTPKLIEQCQVMVDGDYDLITVPRRMYMLGINDANSPWYVANYKYLVNRTRVDISHKVHRIFTAKNNKEGHIQYAPDCCVYHLAYTDGKHWLDTMIDYWQAEARESTDLAADIKECANAIKRHDARLEAGGQDLFLLRLAWNLYHIGTAFCLEERRRGMDIASIYKTIQDKLIKEWNEI
jgi:glycosyltransferase involved in cell wall biosynthesis